MLYSYHVSDSPLAQVCLSAWAASVGNKAEAEPLEFSPRES